MFINHVWLMTTVTACRWRARHIMSCDMVTCIRTMTVLTGYVIRRLTGFTILDQDCIGRIIMADTTGKALVCYVFSHHVAAVTIRTVRIINRACIIMGCGMFTGFRTMAIPTGNRPIITCDCSHYIRVG